MRLLQFTAGVLFLVIFAGIPWAFIQHPHEKPVSWPAMAMLLVSAGLFVLGMRSLLFPGHLQTRFLGALAMAVGSALVLFFQGVDGPAWGIALTGCGVAAAVTLWGNHLFGNLGPGANNMAGKEPGR